jgi:hypothetical protein
LAANEVGLGYSFVGSGRFGAKKISNIQTTFSV